MEMLDRMNNAIAGNEGPKWVLYSVINIIISVFDILKGHDVTFALVLTAFNIEMDFWPPYAAHLVMELWESDNEGK